MPFVDFKLITAKAAFEFVRAHGNTPSATYFIVDQRGTCLEDLPPAFVICRRGKLCQDWDFAFASTIPGKHDYDERRIC
jgi:hypothetical protein